MYKAFNTFIDDVFAFIIKMPTTHRIACFRDDIVFFCYLYQESFEIEKKNDNLSFQPCFFVGLLYTKAELGYTLKNFKLTPLVVRSAFT